jgi:magnesium-transporting ATPase (P-type)
MAPISCSPKSGRRCSRPFWLNSGVRSSSFFCLPLGCHFLHDPINALIILIIVLVSGRVDSEMVDHPRRWNIKAIRRFMFTFGLVSSVFDYLTFSVLLFILHATKDQFRTGWFLKSVVSASLIVLVIRSRKPFFKSRPAKYLSMATLLTVVATVVLPFTPLGGIVEFSPLPISFLVLIAIIVVLYIIAAEIMRAAFYKKVNCEDTAKTAVRTFRRRTVGRPRAGDCHEK